MYVCICILNYMYTLESSGFSYQKISFLPNAETKKKMNNNCVQLNEIKG